MFQWIERLTGWDPDAGSGMLEALIFVVLFALALKFLLRRGAR